jgi:hypothetical protein
VETFSAIISAIIWLIALLILGILTIRTIIRMISSPKLKPQEQLKGDVDET